MTRVASDIQSSSQRNSGGSQLVLKPLLTDELTLSLINWLAHCMNGSKLRDGLSVWLINWLGHCLPGWLTQRLQSPLKQASDSGKACGCDSQDCLSFSGGQDLLLSPFLDYFFFFVNSYCCLTCFEAFTCFDPKQSHKHFKTVRHMLNKTKQKNFLSCHPCTLYSSVL